MVTVSHVRRTTVTQVRPVHIASADMTAPTVSLSRTGRRGELSATAQTVAINATAADAVGVTRVEFYDGATLLGTDTTSPYSFGMGDNISQ